MNHESSSSWGTVNNQEGAWMDYELYARPGSRPRKTASTINSPFMSGGGGISSRSFTKGRTQVDGAYSLYLATHGMQYLLSLISGDSSGVLEDPSETQVSDFTPLNGGVDNTLPSCSIIHAFETKLGAADGDEISVTQGSLFTGMMANQMSISCGGEDSLAEMTMGFLGKDESAITVLDTAYKLRTGGTDTIQKSHLAGEYFIGWKARLFLGAAGNAEADASDDWTETPFFDFSMNINNNLAFPEFINNTTTHNKPEKTNVRDVTGSFTLAFNGSSDFASGGILDDIFNATVKSVRFDFNRYEDTGTTGANPKQYFRMIFPNVVFTGEGSPGSIDHGLVRIPVSFRATQGSSATPANEYVIRVEPDANQA